MTDLADIGFRVDTSDLDKAVTKLNALKPAAAGVVGASDKMTAAVEGANAAIVSAATSAARAEAQKAAAVLKGLQANSAATASEKSAAMAILKTAQANLAAKMAEENRIKTLNAIANANRKVEMAAQAAAAAQNTPIKPPPGMNPANNNIPRDMMPNRFNTANLAAQFQDIGVTASMGMNPLLIAIQQGTQLSAILNTMEKPLQGLAIALRSVFNAVSLGTIAIVAIVAALLQLVNWTKVAKTVVHGLADAVQVATPYVLGLGVALTLLYSRTIIAGIASLSVSLVTLGATALATGAKMAMAWVIGLGPVGWAIAGVAAVAAAFQLFGVNVVGYMKDAANGIIGAFVGAFNAVKATWKMLPAVMGDLVIQAVNIVLSKIEGMINGTIDMINGLLDSLPESLRPAGGKITWKADVQIDNPFEGQAAKAGAEAGKAFSEAFKQDYVGKSIEFAQQLGDAAAKSMHDFANGIGKDKDEKKKKDPWEELLKGAERRINVLKAEQQAIGMTEEATAKLKYETELLNEAQQKNINLTPQMRAQISGLATEMAATEEKTRRLKAAYDFVKEGAKGFFQDIKQGLQEGKSLWQSFGDAVINVLNKILDKMLNSGVDMLFDALMGGGGGGGGSDILSSIGSWLFSAKGNVFDQSGLVPFKKGGAFTNSIVSKPTAFAFASGGAFGVMGEAGAEAVMPLHKGPDGSLGVKMMGGGGNENNVILNVNNYGDSKVSTQQRTTSDGIEIDVMIDEMVAQKISDQSSATNRSLNLNNNRRLISR